VFVPDRPIQLRLVFVSNATSLSQIGAPDAPVKHFQPSLMYVGKASGYYPVGYLGTLLHNQIQ
jgi:hypothetical protein